MRLRFTAIMAFVLLSGCASPRSFSDVVGNVRVTGEVQQNALQRDIGTVDVRLYDARTGYPIDASDVQIKAGRERSVHASRKQLGVYTADIAERHHIDLLITTRDDRSIFLALQQR